MNIGIVGGDSRIVELVKILQENNNKVKLYGLELCSELKNFDNENTLEDLLKNVDTIITSIPLSKNGKFINSAFTNEEILIEDFFELSKNKTIITGNITNEIKNCIKNNENNIIDILKLEELAILNSIPTAEGAIQIAMEKSLKTIHGSKCLVLGFGRIGKVLSKMLYGIGANVYCEARKSTDIAWIESYKYNAIHLEELNKYLGDFDFIFNTIPYVILDKNNLKLIKKDCLLIDLASNPGGIDFNEAERLQLQTVWALALPGKVAPKTAATYIYKILKNIIKI